jgi:hypothetical protein
MAVETMKCPIQLLDGLSARKFHAADAIICKAFRGAAVVNLPQAPDNEANGRISLRPKGEVVFALF